MRNFTLLRYPCNFLDLRISPWEVLFPFLLSLPFLFSPLAAALSGSLSLPPSLCLLQAGVDPRGARPEAACGARGGRLWLGAVLARRRSRRGLVGGVGARAREELRRSGSAWTSRETTRHACEGAAARAARAALERSAGAGGELGTGGSVQACARGCGGAAARRLEAEPHGGQRGRARR
jgi:hypothetical protein